jgi:altronate dehydratase small subunit
VGKGLKALKITMKIEKVTKKFKTQRKAIVIDSKDNVATARVNLEKSGIVAIETGESTFDITLLQDIPYGHKVSLKEIKKGGPVIKYGETIGLATIKILPGQHVHVHNVEGTRGRGDKQ